MRSLIGAVCLALMASPAFAQAETYTAMFVQNHVAFTVPTPSIEDCAKSYESTVTVRSPYYNFSCYNPKGQIVLVGSCDQNFTGSVATCTIRKVENNVRSQIYYDFQYRSN